MLETSARLLRLLTLLQARRFWSGTELADRLGVTSRTVRRDVERLRTLGYAVSSSVGVAGGYQLDAGATVPPLLLDDEEALAIALSLRTVASGTVSGADEAALRALVKLDRVLPARLQRRVRAMHGAVVPMDMGLPQIDATLLMTLASASRDRLQVSFQYADRQGKRTRRRVQPHGLVHAGVRWYLVAFDRVRDDWRTFRIDRIAGSATCGESFSPRQVPGGDLAGFVSQSVGSQAYAHRARILIHAPRERIAARVSPLGGQLTAVSPRRCLLDTGANSLWQLASFLVTLGEEFEVQSPPALNDELAAIEQRLSRAAGRAAARLGKTRPG